MHQREATTQCEGPTCREWSWSHRGSRPGDFNERPTCRPHHCGPPQTDYNERPACGLHQRDRSHFRGRSRRCGPHQRSHFGPPPTHFGPFDRFGSGPPPHGRMGPMMSPLHNHRGWPHHHRGSWEMPPRMCHHHHDRRDHRCGHHRQQNDESNNYCFVYVNRSPN